MAPRSLLAAEAGSILVDFLARVDWLNCPGEPDNKRAFLDALRTNLFSRSLAAHLAFCVIQALLTPRLVRKKYRSFRVYVVRPDGSLGRRLSIWETVRIWLWIFVPQFWFLLAVSLTVWFWRTATFDIVQGFSSIFLWLWLLVVGPYAVGLALRMNYRGFRLQPHGLK